MHAAVEREQRLIGVLVEKLARKEEVDRALLKLIKTKYHKSAMLTYYAGFYHEQQGDVDDAAACFLKCNRLAPHFPAPVFHLANYVRAGRLDAAAVEPLLTHLLGRPTLDPTTGHVRYSSTDQLIACSFLAPCCCASKKKMRQLFENVLKRLSSAELEGYSELEGFKNACLTLASAWFEELDERCMQHYVRGLAAAAVPSTNNPRQQETLRAIDQRLHQGFAIAKDFFAADYALPISPSALYQQDDADLRRTMAATKILKKKTITTCRIGYVSPDFNKNAVGLFLTPLLKHADRDRFQVFCYYTQDADDEYTEGFRRYPGVTWTNIARMSDADAAALMRHQHGLDVVVDLIACGRGNRLGLMALRPARVVINYLGYPGCTHLRAHTHRLVDAITDPVDVDDASVGRKQYDHTERLLRMPRTFLCYHMFEGCAAPRPATSSALDPDDPVVRIGITNRSLKMSPEILGAWKRIVAGCRAANRRVRLVVKLDLGGRHRATTRCARLEEALSDDAGGGIEYVPFMDRLEDYLALHRRVDFCLDTYPYSGTTTTCSALFMGRPVFTVYDPAKGRHASNVSASIQLHMGPEFSAPFVAEGVDDYVARVIAFCKDHDNIRRLRDAEAIEARREAFARIMDPLEFMRDYEACILEALEEN